MEGASDAPADVVSERVGEWKQCNAGQERICMCRGKSEESASARP